MKIILNTIMTFAGENLCKFVPRREAYCLWTEQRLDVFRDLNLSKKSKLTFRF